METQTAVGLIKELKINKLLPKYNDQGVSDVAQEINLQFKSINEKLS